jgi:PKHD-type hydroxylase
MVVCLDGILSSEELAAIRGRLRDAPWATGISAGPQAAQVKHNQQLPEDAPQLRELRLMVMRALNRSPLLISAALPNKILPPNFNRYAGDTNAYGWHIDNSLRTLPDGSWLRTDLSATLFLSEPEEYAGGELVVQDTYGEHRIKLAAGSLVLYPSGSVHQVRPVTSGERLACYLFLQSLVRDNEARRQLHEMDRALMALRSELGESNPQVVQLTATYHYLLRRWSQC